MINNKILKVTMALGLVLVGLGVSIAGASASSKIDLTAQTGGGPFVAGQSYKIGDLLRLINGSAAQQGKLSSQFLMPAPNNGKVPITTAQYNDTKNNEFQQKKDGKTGKSTYKMGSISPSRASGISVDLSCDASDNTLVKLLPANTQHLDAVAQHNNLNTNQKSTLAKIMLWFDLKGYAAFICDPWGTGWAKNIDSKWITK